MLSPSPEASPRAAQAPAGRRAGPDACPGALSVHAAADGGLARVRLPGGRVAAAALAALAAAAAELGSGVLELTSRGNVQLRGLGPGSEGELSGRLRAAGLLPSDTHERVRNIVASPLTGLLAGDRPDVSALVAALDAGLRADPGLAGLPGRFLFAVDDGAADVTALGADVGLLAAGTGTYALLLGGVDPGLRPPAHAAVAGALAAARAFLAERAAQGSAAWRIAELPGGRAAVAARLRRAQIPCLDGSGGPAEVATALTVPRAPEPGPHPQRDGRVALVVLVPAGRLDAAAARALAAAAGPAALRVTPWRSVVLPGLDAGSVDAVAAALGAHGLVTDPGSAWAGVSACAGRPGCARAVADVRAAAAAVVPGPRAAAPGARPLPVHWAACERRCGRPPGSYVDVLATADGFEVRRDGRLVAVGDAATVGRAASAERATP